MVFGISPGRCANPALRDLRLPPPRPPPMLSPVAATLYWMSRYLERAEHTARVIDINLNLMLDQSPASAGPRWERVLASLRAEGPEGTSGDSYAICRTLTFEGTNSSSILACVAAARE